MTETRNECKELSDSNGSLGFNPAHLTWILPCGLLMSPFGTITIALIYSMNFNQVIQLVAAQVIAFLLVYACSNGGK